MIILRVVLVITFANQPNQEVSVDTFVVMNGTRFKSYKRSPAAIRKIMMIPMRQAFSGMPSPTGASTSRFGVARSLARAFLLLLDLVEFVATNFSNLLKASEELLVHVSNNFLLWSNNRVLNAVRPE